MEQAYIPSTVPGPEPVPAAVRDMVRLPDAQYQAAIRQAAKTNGWFRIRGQPVAVVAVEPIQGIDIGYRMVCVDNNRGIYTGCVFGPVVKEATT